jgi:hypothetical protein
MELRRGDLIEVHWVDIYEDVIGDPERADVAPRISIGYFWAIKPGVFVTTTTMDSEATGQNGYCAYPLACVTLVKMIRRGKGKVYRERPSFSYDVPSGHGVGGAGLADAGDPGKRSRTGKVRGHGDQPEFDADLHEAGKCQA